MNKIISVVLSFILLIASNAVYAQEGIVSKMSSISSLQKIIASYARADEISLSKYYKSYKKSVSCDKLAEELALKKLAEEKVAALAYKTGEPDIKKKLTPSPKLSRDGRNLFLFSFAVFGIIMSKKALENIGMSYMLSAAETMADKRHYLSASRLPYKYTKNLLAKGKPWAIKRAVGYGAGALASFGLLAYTIIDLFTGAKSMSDFALSGDAQARVNMLENDPSLFALPDFGQDSTDREIHIGIIKSLIKKEPYLQKYMDDYYVVLDIVSRYPMVPTAQALEEISNLPAEREAKGSVKTAIMAKYLTSFDNEMRPLVKAKSQEEINKKELLKILDNTAIRDNTKIIVPFYPF
jgi:hypothetical protein